jgi:2-oxoglutarate dehydrogenase E2 component (dihydrolipoamide succinyltransferase)
MSRMRQRIGERLKASQNTYATLTTFNEVDMSEVMQMRNKFQEEFNKKYGIKMGFMSFFLKASTMALQEMPVVNSVIDGTDIIHRDYIDISVAVATPNGLMVPVIRNCENKSLADFEVALRDLSILARDNKIKIEDMAGGNFSISNGGVYGSMMGTPIINPPQTAILGMHNIVNRAVVRGEDIVARPMMYLALSYDHRLIDGREGVLFLKKIRDLIEEPRKMLLNI